MVSSDAILFWFRQYSNPSSPLYQKAFLPIYPDDFVTDIARGTLPSVSWLIPPIGYDEHPPSPSAMGEWYTGQILTALMANPAVWSKTVVFHTYDENDGFFDHVPPPVAPAGTRGEYLSASPLPATAQGIAGPLGLGYRVPMLVISPFSRGGHVASEVSDHTSQLRFLEARFGVKAPNISSWRRTHTGDLTTALHMGHATASTPRLPSTAHDQQPDMAALGCTVGDVVGAGNDQPVYPVPAHQSMPRQERTRR
jgi:phospholipase C